MTDTLVKIEPNTQKNLAEEQSPVLLDHFPFNEVRPSQEIAATVMEQWLKSPQKFMIYEGPCGSGKSALNIMAASYSKILSGFDHFKPGSYILTPQKSLAEQYMKDFESMGLMELRGRSNYHCEKWTKIQGSDTNCETGAILNNSIELTNQSFCSACPYRIAKDEFIRNPLGTTNFDYYLHEANYVHELPDRNLLTLDEGHNCEEKILSMTNTVISRQDCKKYGVNTLPIFTSGDSEKVTEWLDKIFVPHAMVYMENLNKRAKKASAKKCIELTQEITELNRFLLRIKLFRKTQDPAEWYVWSDWQAGRGGTGDLNIKPLTARLFANDMLFSKAQKVLITSATILDFPTFMRSLGIFSSDAITLATPSEFNVKNRPIFFNPMGSMNFKFIEETLPKVAQAVDQLLTRYSDKKGIVHTHTYYITQYLTKFLKNTKWANRILTHDNTRGSRERALERHFEDCNEPTVLFSPSMSEGLDLKDELSRFQIICKIPYPPLTSYIKARMNHDPDWYQWSTALKLIQATGRSVRSHIDQANTHILDKEFANFIGKNNRKMPQWWVNSIIW